MQIDEAKFIAPKINCISITRDPRTKTDWKILKSKTESDKDQDKIGNLGPGRIRINQILKIWDRTACLWILDCDSIYNHKL